MNPSIVRNAVVVAHILITVVSASRWEANLGWCHGANEKLHEGDFNGDGRTDLLCRELRLGQNRIAFANAKGQFTGTSWQDKRGWCGHATDASDVELHVGDFNGDGRSDLLCHGTDSGYNWIAHANIDGNFRAGTTWKDGQVWCPLSWYELHIGDFNGDGRDDMLCHDTDDGYKWISFANAAGNFEDRTGWQGATAACGGELHIGDFNGDGRDDTLCHGNIGNIWISYADDHGYFPLGTSWEKQTGWCGRDGESIQVGDVNGDGKDDMVCHDSNNGYKRVALANCQNDFSGGTLWEADLDWCKHTAHFFLGDYNGDSKADMLCLDDINGYTWVIYASQLFE